MALVICTSGSTGRPKGVPLTHANLVHSVAAILEYLPLSEHPRTAVVLPLHYAYPLIGQVLAACAAGAHVTFLPPSPFAPDLLAGLVAARAQGLSSVPFSLARICTLAEEEEVALDGVGYVASAGARLPLELVPRLRRVFPRARLFNQYGCTEAAPRVSFLESSDPRFERGAVGFPIRGLELAILDGEGRRLGPHAEGEIAIRGPNVMAAYLDEEPGPERRAGFLLTGDRGFLDDDGCLFVSGRRDRIVQCAGERVSLDEVEHAIRAHPSLADAAVVALEHPLLGAEIAALVVGDPGRAPELRAHLGRALSPAKRPRRLRYVPSIPRSPSGKTQHETLAALARGDTAAGETGGRATDPSEEPG